MTTATSFLWIPTFLLQFWLGNKYIHALQSRPMLIGNLICTAMYVVSVLAIAKNEGSHPVWGAAGLFGIIGVVLVSYWPQKPKV